MLTPPPSLFIWFLLFDSVTGEPYKGTTAEKVCVSTSADVADFRDAVQLKYDKPNYLKEIPSGALLVYKNKTAFEKRNAAVDEGKEAPLKEDSPIDGLGLSKKDALIVVVPSTIQRSYTQSSFPYCQVPFYNNLHSANEFNGWISFEQNIPSTTLKNLYIRESYRTIASNITPGINKAIITGTPGIGKSLFLIYLLWK